MAFFQDFPVLENAIIKFHDFPGFPGPVRTLLAGCYATYYPFEQQGVSAEELSADSCPPSSDPPALRASLSPFPLLRTPDTQANSHTPPN